MSKVVKFGGSSLASAEQFKKVGEIIRADATRRFVVPSAPGKRFPKDTKVTDMLYACYELAEQEKDFSKELADIRERYQEIIDGLELTLDLSDEFSVIEKKFREKNEGIYSKYQHKRDETEPPSDDAAPREIATTCLSHKFIEERQNDDQQP